MIKLEKTEVVGWEHAIRGMRNPKNSWEKSDSGLGCRGMRCKNCGFNPNWCGNTPATTIGPNDHKLMMSLAAGGPVHAKYRRMITVYVDITAPLYWWKEFDTYRVGVEKNSCSTMHKIHDKEITLDDFSHEHLTAVGAHAYPLGGGWRGMSPIKTLETIVELLNTARKLYIQTKDKAYWWQMIQLLPTSYNQKRTVMFNYEVLHNIYHSRKDHKLDEWHAVCDWIKSLPYSEIITGEDAETKEIN